MFVNCLTVSAGAAFGVLVRVLSTNWIKRQWTYTFPFATFVINILGSLLLGLLTGLSVGSVFSLLAGTGFMGSFTTFSTFNVENVELLREKRYKYFFSYVGASYILGVLAAFLGIILGNLLKH
ncbi:CrcB family protein [Tetragenococcus halophilus]|uniref:fluoride efflux transporter FluC n=1 Tax=Tetragenococcus halophilus TaxID=51669 RepID=UPI0030F123A7